MIRVQFFRSRGRNYPTFVHGRVLRRWYMNLPYTHVSVEYGWVAREVRKVVRWMDDVLPAIVATDCTYREMCEVYDFHGVPRWWMWMPRRWVRGRFYRGEAFV